MSSEPPYVSDVKSADAVYALGHVYTILARGRDTGGAYAMMHVTVPPGDGPAPHIHHREAECFYVLEGSVRFSVADRLTTARPGTVVHVPLGTVHTFWNEGRDPARMLIQITPAGLEGFFEGIGTPVTDPSQPPPPFAGPDIVAAIGLAKEFGLEIVNRAGEEEEEDGDATAFTT